MVSIATGRGVLLVPGVQSLAVEGAVIAVAGY
jgi:hypothetical protein